MSFALMLAALLMPAFQLDLKPVGAQSLGLKWPRLIPACVAIGILGALMTIEPGNSLRTCMVTKRAVGRELGFLY